MFTLLNNQRSTVQFHGNLQAFSKPSKPSPSHHQALAGPGPFAVAVYFSDGSWRRSLMPSLTPAWRFFTTMVSEWCLTDVKKMDGDGKTFQNALEIKMVTMLTILEITILGRLPLVYHVYHV